MLKYLLAGGFTAGFSGSLWAQQRQPRPTTVPASSSTAGSTAPAQAGEAQIQSDNQPVLVMPQELERVLREWEEKTAKITKLRGDHQRYEYDTTFQVEKRAAGSFWYEAPDKGRIDFNVKDQPHIPDPPLSGYKFGVDGEPYHVEASEPQTWMCDGTNILQIDIANKVFDRIEIPPHQRGENIMDGPLPFLFGMKAEKLKARYRLSLGEMHDPQGKRRNSQGQRRRPQYHVVAIPTQKDDARNWSRAEVKLDAEFCLPIAIRLLDPSGNKETLYVFPLSKMRANETLPWFPSPFKPPLNGYKLRQTATKEFEPRPRSGGILPVRRSD